MGRITPLSELPLSNDFMFGAFMKKEAIYMAYVQKTPLSKFLRK